LNCGERFSLDRFLRPPQILLIPPDMKLAQRARNGTEKRLSMILPSVHWFWTPIAPLNNRGKKARFSFLTIAKQKKPRLRKFEGPQ